MFYLVARRRGGSFQGMRHHRKMCIRRYLCGRLLNVCNVFVYFGLGAVTNLILQISSEPTAAVCYDHGLGN